MTRKYPKIPLPSVSGIIFNREGSVLLVRRKKHPDKGKWSLPGGVIQTGENLHDALKREVSEECMLNVEVGPLVSASSKIVKTQKGVILYHYVILDYLCRYQEGIPKADSDAADIRWVKTEEINKYELSDGLVEVITKGLKIHHTSFQVGNLVERKP